MPTKQGKSNKITTLGLVTGIGLKLAKNDYKTGKKSAKKTTGSIFIRPPPPPREMAPKVKQNVKNIQKGTFAWIFDILIDFWGGSKVAFFALRTLACTFGASGLCRASGRFQIN